MINSKSSPSSGSGDQGRDNQKRRTRQALIDAAVALRDEGHNPTVAQVAERAMVSRATAYRYFPSTEALIAVRDFSRASVEDSLGAAAWAARALVRQALAEDEEARRKRNTMSSRSSAP